MRFDENISTIIKAGPMFLVLLYSAVEVAYLFRNEQLKTCWYMIIRKNYAIHITYTASFVASSWNRTLNFHIQ